MLAKRYESILCWTSVLLVVFGFHCNIPSALYAQGKSFDCSKQVARIWLDYQIVETLQRDNLKVLSNMSLHDLAALNPLLDQKSIEKVWFLLNESTKNQKTLTSATDELQKQISDQQELLSRLGQKFSSWQDDVATEKQLILLSEEYGFLGNSRVTTIEAIAAIDDKLANFDYTKALSRFLGAHVDPMEYALYIADSFDFKQWIIEGILAPSRSYHRVLRRGLELYQKEYPRYYYADLGLYFENIEDLSVDLFDALIQAGGRDVPDELIFAVIRAYNEFMIGSFDVKSLANELAQELEKARVFWKEHGLVVSSDLPVNVQRFLPLIAYLRSQIAVQRSYREKLKSLVFFDVFADVNGMLYERAGNFEGIAELIAGSYDLVGNGYARPRGFDLADVYANSPSLEKAFVVLAIVQSAMIFSRITGLVVVPNWMFVMSIVLAILLHPRAYPLR